jgi:hypothetical protein
MLRFLSVTEVYSTSRPCVETAKTGVKYNIIPPHVFLCNSSRRRLEERIGET